MPQHARERHRRIADHDHAALVETFASYCRVLSAVRTSRAAWRLRTSCRDEGQAEWEPRTPVTFVLRVNGNSLSLRDDTGVQNLTRCPV